MQYLRLVLCGFSILFGILHSMAVPAKPGTFVFTQPDGTEITVSLHGDERAHYYLSEDNLMLVNYENTLYFATLDSHNRVKPASVMANRLSRLSATDRQIVEAIDQNALSEALQQHALTRMQSTMLSHKTQTISRSDDSSSLYGLYPGIHFPAYGEQRGVVVLVEYQDLGFTIEDPNDYYTRMLNQEGFSDDEATGSARDYFIDSSNGVFQPQFDVYGPVTLSNNYRYYGGNDVWGNDKKPEEMAIEACEMLDEIVDFSLYDGDQNGLIDMVYIIYAGKGEASYGSADTVWPHSWSLDEAGITTQYYYDGVRLNHYACSNEWEKIRPDGVGTFIHEFSHVLGLPDLYNTSYSQAFTPGGYSVLDSGPYNNEARTPPTYGVFERSALGWMEVEKLEPGDYSLENLISSNRGFVIPTEKETEYFLLENRQPIGWDSFLPGHGMLIWHIDYKETAWTNNTVNNNGTHQYVDLLEADNTQNDKSRDGDAFPGAKGITKITDDTKPNLCSWSKTRSQCPIYNIQETDGVISFRAGIHAEDCLAAPVALDATDMSTSTFVAHWEAVEEAETYYLTITQNGEAVAGYEQKAVGNVCKYKVSNLGAATEYEYYVCAFGLGQSSEPSNIISVTTEEKAGISTVEADKVGLQVKGNVVFSSGAQAFTPDGRLVGSGSVITLAPGLYIVKIGTLVYKVKI